MNSSTRWKSDTFFFLIEITNLFFILTHAAVFCFLWSSWWGTFYYVSLGIKFKHERTKGMRFLNVFYPFFLLAKFEAHCAPLSAPCSGPCPQRRMRRHFRRGENMCIQKFSLIDKQSRYEFCPENDILLPKINVFYPGVGRCRPRAHATYAWLSFHMNSMSRLSTWVWYEFLKVGRSPSIV